jgi:hypothetical protein
MASPLLEAGGVADMAPPVPPCEHVRDRPRRVGRRLRAVPEFDEPGEFVHARSEPFEAGFEPVKR